MIICHLFWRNKLIWLHFSTWLLHVNRREHSSYVLVCQKGGGGLGGGVLYSIWLLTGSQGSCLRVDFDEVCGVAEFADLKSKDTHPKFQYIWLPLLVSQPFMIYIYIPKHACPYLFDTSCPCIHLNTHSGSDWSHRHTLMSDDRAEKDIHQPLEETGLLMVLHLSNFLDFCEGGGGVLWSFISLAATTGFFQK